MKPPPFYAVFLPLVAVGVLLLAGGIALRKKEKIGRCCCGCSVTCGALLIAVALLFAVALAVLMRKGGPEPAAPVPQQPETLEVNLEATIPFQPAELNAPGPVRSAYMRGMQLALAGASGDGGAGMSVVGMKAQSARALLQRGEEVPEMAASRRAAALLQQSGEEAEEATRAANRVTISYDVEVTAADATHSETEVLNSAVESLPAGIVEAAKEVAKDVGGPGLLKEIAGGTRTAIAADAAEVAVNASFQCTASHNQDTLWRAVARVALQKLAPVAEREIEKYVGRRLPGYHLKLAERCNDPQELAGLKVCLGPTGAWFDLVSTAKVKVPEGRSSEEMLCSASCRLSEALVREKAAVFEYLNHLYEGLTVADDVVWGIGCSPALFGAQSCGACGT